jgi:hypothetical protein
VNRLKVLVCAVVAVLALGIIVYKTTSAKNNNAVPCGNGGFLNPLADTKDVAGNRTGQRARILGSIPAMRDIDAIAANLDTVFLLVPSKDNALAPKETSEALSAVGGTLSAKGIRAGVFTLQIDSPDYQPIVAKLLSVPGIVILTKGRGNSVISGEISEGSLMQAYVASTRAGGCCPPGGSAPCK